MEAFLDANAGAPLHPLAKEAVAKAIQDGLTNPSGYGKPSRECREVVENARAKIANFFGADPIEIIFTAGGSESINSAIFAGCGAPSLRKAFCSSAEHHASISALDACAGPASKRLSVDENGLLKGSDELEAQLAQADFLSLIWASNELGSINDVNAVDQVCAKLGLPWHLDAVCAAGKLEIDLHSLPSLSFASFSGHKFHALAGCGFLYVRRGTRYQPLIVGGHQERGRRAGTENLLGIISMAAALDADWPAMRLHMQAMRERFESGLKQLGGVKIHAEGAKRLPNTSSVAFLGRKAPEILAKLDQKGVYASAGAACTTGALEPSHVLLASGMERELAESTVRFSNSGLTSAKEVDYALEVIADLG